MKAQQPHLTIFVEGTASLSNTTINIQGTREIRFESVTWEIIANSPYSLNNVTFRCIDGSDYNCSNLNINVTIATNYPQDVEFVNVNCIDKYNNDNIDICNANKAVVNVDNETRTRIRLLTQLIDEFEFEYSNECNNSNNNNSNMIFDIGYPLYGEQLLVNDEEGAAICCRGSESCAYSKRIYSNLGTIFCTGVFSCGLSQSIWTSDFVDIIGL